MTDSASAALTFLQGLPMTMASSPSNSTFVAKSGMRIGASGPMTAVGGFRNIVGGSDSPEVLKTSLTWSA